MSEVRKTTRKPVTTGAPRVYVIFWGSQWGTVSTNGQGYMTLAGDPKAVCFLTDAKRHCKAVGFSGIPSLAKKSGVEEESGVIDIGGKAGVKDFISAGRTGRFWERETE